MYRATTPTHIFTFPEEVNPQIATAIKITYKQCHEIVVEKNLGDFMISGQKIFVTLTQEELNKFSPDLAGVQIRVKMPNGSVLASQIIKIKVKQVLNAEVI